MKFSLEKNAKQFSINAYSDQGIQINEQWYYGHILLMPESLISDWSAPEVEKLETQDLEPLLIHQPKVILLGTGQRLIFPHAKLIAEFAQQGIGLEVMNTQAACRTYNILLSEGRQVAAALVRQS